MQRLATELGCSVMSLYNHVPSKSALLDGVADQVMSAIEVIPMTHGAWEERLHAQASAVRKIAGAHPRCAMMAVSRRPAPVSMVRQAETALATLREGGFGGQDAVRILRTFLAYISGSILREVGVAPGQADADEITSARRCPRAAEFPQVPNLSAELHADDPEADFEFGLELLMHAVVSRSCAPSRRDPATVRTEVPAGAPAASSSPDRAGHPRCSTRRPGRAPRPPA